MADLEEICNLLALCIAGFATLSPWSAQDASRTSVPHFRLWVLTSVAGSPIPVRPTPLTISPVLKDFGHNSFRVYVCMATQGCGTAFLAGHLKIFFYF
jgi:hypothetical protein